MHTVYVAQNKAMAYPIFLDNLKSARRGTAEIASNVLSDISQPAPCFDYAVQHKQTTPTFLHSGASPMEGSSACCLSSDKFGLPFMSPWLNLYSNLMHSHFLQFQCVHGDANNDTAASTTKFLQETHAPPSSQGGNQQKLPLQTMYQGMASRSLSTFPQNVADVLCFERPPSFDTSRSAATKQID
ncbi:hypothetical protein PoB_000183800 [Plakobranchus ocellatus]|uniref:Uncharacterized protein n=1 Tax=Plakobranchus ocellatus TaxID=259542 RepID=A0AAV3XYA5_9GAST|nr:hypothetical protein PoB_000183800 [Plakobranchus ocellatus]